MTQPPPSPPRLAGLLRRAVALVLDLVILLSAALWLRQAYLRAGLYSGAANQTLWFYPVAGLLVLQAYQFLFLALMQSTPGMALLRLSLAQADGRAPTPQQALVRVLVGTLSAAALGVGYFWALFHPRRQTWHDLAADTIIIFGLPARARRARPSPSRSGPTTYRIG